MYRGCYDSLLYLTVVYHGRYDSVMILLYLSVVYRGCYAGEWKVNPHTHGCSYQAGSLYCFCRGDRLVKPKYSIIEITCLTRITFNVHIYLFKLYYVSMGGHRFNQPLLRIEHGGLGVKRDAFFKKL